MKYKCPYCKFKTDNKKSLYSHLENQHNDLLPPDISISRFYFNYRNKKTKGTCTVCGGESSWNETAERYDRICSEKCKKIYVDNIVKARMKNKYGKEHLLDEPDFQRKMLRGRSISGTYKWSDNITSINYTGSYELDFLKFMDLFLNWNSNDIMECPFTLDYMYDGKKLFYIPDFYIASINTIVEIKDGGDNPNNHHKIQGVDKVKEKLKDEALIKSKKYNYIKLTNKNYSNFIEFLFKLKEAETIVPEDKNFKPVTLIGECFQSMTENIINEMFPV